MMDHDDNYAAKITPNVGDFWHEMYNPVCSVIAVGFNQVCVATKIKNGFFPGTWTWDTDAKPKILTLDRFKEWLGPAQVIPRRDTYLADHFPKITNTKQKSPQP